MCTLTHTKYVFPHNSRPPPPGSRLRHHQVSAQNLWGLAPPPGVLWRCLPPDLGSPVPRGPRWAPHSGRGGPVSCSNLERSGPGCFQGAAPAPQQAAPPPQPDSSLGVSGTGDGHPPQAKDQSSRRLQPGRNAPGHGRAFSARSRHGTRKPADTKRLSCFFSQRWKLYRNTAETTRMRVYNTLFRPMPLPHDG